MLRSDKRTLAVSSLALALIAGIAARPLLERFYVNFGIRPEEAAQQASAWTVIVATALLGGFLGILLGRGALHLRDRWATMGLGDRVTFFVGVFGGLIASVPLVTLANAAGNLGAYQPLLILGVVLGTIFLSVYALQSMEEALPWNRAGFRGKRRGIKVLDTNVIIDGRIRDVARSGFIEGQLYVPGFVLDELQHIADSPDPLRRQRGRRGLDVLHLLQSEFPLEVRVHDRYAPDPKEPVDSRLVRLARALGADIITNDFNLNRVAALQDVKVLNLNDLALAVRPNVLPQECLTLTLIREGNQPGQGVGYLDDGTMVVVENGRPHIGETIEVMVTQVIQTERGKLLFAEPTADGHANAENGQRRRAAARKNG
ncbi:MAG: TRAM domain-containing protein [Fimbriimonadales bacterium]|nr:TRAM domain-containing protein [Fimbriimonadales bacterium]